MNAAIGIPIVLLTLLGVFGIGVSLPRRKGTGTGANRSLGDWVVRALFAVPYILLALFCGFGFLASFEPGPHLVFKIAYSALGLASAAVAGWLIGRN